MEDTAKYLIHADITADGVVERSDVVGAVFGQTEGLLGDDLDLRDLQQTSKVGRIDVDVASQNGQSYGTITIASSLDKAETSILAAALETIGRVGPCRASVSIADIEDMRAAKRREVVERAKDLLASAFDDDVMTSDQILEEVRQSARVERITDYEGFPAGPRVADSDAIIVVEGRSDVITLLGYGVKNAVAVEGTNVPEEIAALTQERTVTAFLDGDRGGDLILRELAQVGDVDHVAFAPENRSVEDLSRHEALAALRKKVPFETVEGRAADSAADGGGAAAEPEHEAAAEPSAAASADADPSAIERPGADLTDDAGADSAEAGAAGSRTADDSGDPELDATAEREANAEPDAAAGSAEAAALDAAEAAAAPPESLHDHVREVIDDGTGTVRLLDSSFAVLAEAPAADAFDALADADGVPHAVVLDDTLDQRVLDVAAQRGVSQIVAREEGQFTKKPTGVRVRLGRDLTATG